VEKNKINGDFVKNIADIVEKVKEHKELGIKYMSMLAEYYDVRREGIREGEKRRHNFHNNGAFESGAVRRICLQNLKIFAGQSARNRKNEQSALTDSKLHN